MKDLDWILDSNDVATHMGVDVVDHRRKRGCLPGARGPGYQHYSPGFRGYRLHNSRQHQFLKGRDPGSYSPDSDRDAPALSMDVYAEPTHLRSAVCKVYLASLAELTNLPVTHQRGGVVLGDLRTEVFLVKHLQVTVEPENGWAAHLQMKFGGPSLTHLLSKDSKDCIRYHPLPLSTACG